MRDLFEAIEQLSAVLAMRIEKAANKRGWATSSSTRALSPAPGRSIHLVAVSVTLPQGVTASFTPRPDPSGQGWAIDVQRSDGVVRRSFVEGLRVEAAAGGYQVQLQGRKLDEELVNLLLDELGKPGPSGVALWVRKVWAIRFGRMPTEVAEIIDRVKDADRLDQMHAAVLRSADLQAASGELLRLAGA